MQDLPFDLLLFDLGGVLVENVGPARLATWLPTTSSHAAILDQWLTSPTVRAFESGQMAAEDFAGAMVQEFALPVSPTHFLADFARWVNRLYPGVLDLLRRLSSAYPLGCLSNINVLHWQRGRTVMQLDTLFDYTFVSCETGLLKPDGEAFLHVIQQTGYAPERIVFFDDSQRNVDSAAGTGMVACKTAGLAELHSALREFAILGRGSMLQP
jgi:putative hydrolase of the HAD superfamily